MVKPNIRIGYENGYGEMALVKPFSIDGKEGWHELSRKRTKGVLRIYPLYREIEVEFFKGCNPEIQDLLLFLIKDKDIKRMICEYQRNGSIMAQLSRQKSKIFIMNRYAWL